MVEHDESRLRTWSRIAEEHQEQSKERKGIPHRVSVVAVQSIACCVVVLLALLLKMAGGEAYRSLQHRFQQALLGNEWASALALLWDGDPLQQAESADVKVGDFTAEEVLNLTDFQKTVTAMAPLANGVLTSAYGERSHPINGTQEFHSGVDVAAPQGADLLAAYDGVVVEVGEDAQLGKYIRLEHSGGIEIVYGHCAEIIAERGAQVRAGERVALVGSTGVSTGSHVHIRVDVNGEVCDPGTLLPLELYA